jgi:Prokaryotic E2 family E/Multiubiquitin
MEQTLSSPTAAHANIVNVAGTDLVFHAVPVTDRTPTARQVLAAMGLAPLNEYVVLQWLPGGDIEEVRPEETVDMTDATTPKLIIARADRTFRLVLNDHSLEWPESEISEEALRTLGAISPSQQIYLVHKDEGDRQVDPGEKVNLRAGGVETVYSKSGEWKLKVQGVTIESRVPEISVRDAMVRAGFDTEAKWIIILKSAAGKKQVDLGYVIDLREPGIEKLRLTPREINNGEVVASIQRDFPLLPTDHTWLDDHGYDWSTVLESGRRWLILRDVALPAGFNVPSARIAMEIPTAYPMAEIDMFYCFPHLVRGDGREIPQTQINQPIGGRQFQRWSRHRGAVAPWRPGKDSIVTHLLLVDEALNREVEP